MHLHFKNTLSALLISTAIFACGGGSDTSKSSGSGSPSSSQSAPSSNPNVLGEQNTIASSGSESQSTPSSNQEPLFDGPALTNQSIADGSIRPEIGTLTKEITKLMSESDKAKQIELIQNTLDQMKKFLSTSQNQQERDLLHMYIKGFTKQLDIYKIADTIQRSKAIHEKFMSLTEEQTMFLRKYIQSPQLRSLILQMQAGSKEKAELEAHPEKVKERKAIEAKSRELARKFLAFYDDPNLDDQTKTELKALDDLGLLTAQHIQNMRRFAYPESQPLSAETPDPSNTVSLRRVRSKNPSTDFTQLMVNGLVGGYAPLQMPIYVQLKGTVENSKETKDLTGTVVYKFNNTLVGMIHGHANASNNKLTSLNHNESSVVVSHSFGKTFLEGQAGVIHSTINHHNVSGERYQLSAGYDFEYFTPFVQASTRNLNAVNEHSVQAGCEVDVMNLVTDQYKLSTRMTLKGGYHSFKGTIGSFEGSFELGLNSGVNIQTGVKLSNNNESAAKISVSFDH